MWTVTPYPILFQIFSYLNYKELVKVGITCQYWYEVSRDNLLWKRLFLQIFNTEKSLSPIKGKTWYQEFKRLCFHIPIVQTETLKDHANQVLHVSFSHNGRYFATCSKDGYVLVWSSEYPAKIKFSKNMKKFNWKYAQYSQFNETDTLLLVSGIHIGSVGAISGEIIVLSFEEEFELQCRIINRPYDFFGTWYNDQYLLSSDLHLLGQLVTSSFIWINKASQETTSEHVPVTHNLYKFYNKNANSIRTVKLARCLSNYEETNNIVGQNNNDPYLVNNNEINTINETNEDNFCECFKDVNANNEISSIRYNAKYRDVEFRKCGNISEAESILSDIDYDFKERNDSKTSINLFGNNKLQSEDLSGVRDDKLLIFTTGCKTYTPHQIGFKVVKLFTFPNRMEPGPSLRERIELQERRREQLLSESPPEEPDWFDIEAIADKFDKIDHLIDLHGHIIGMKVTPDHRYLYVNCRPWPYNYTIPDPLDPPPVSQEIDIHVIDLVTFEQVGVMLRSHKAYTPNEECFFIYLDVCEKYVASGAEDNHAYLWDRHFGNCLIKYYHSDIVNCVSFNPKDDEMLVSTSDDNTIKIWRSKSAAKKLGLDFRKFEQGIELKKK